MNISNKTNKRFSKLLSILFLCLILYFGYVYGIILCGIKILEPDFRCVYAIVCKNTNFTRQRVSQLKIEDDSIFVSLKVQSIPYLLTAYDMCQMDFNSALNIYSDLKEQFADRKIYVNTGAVGSSKFIYSVDDGIFTFGRSCLIKDECKLKVNDMLIHVVKNEKIHGIAYNWTHVHFFFNKIKNIPLNTTITSLVCVSSYTKELNAIESFQGLTDLNITFIDEDENDCTEAADLCFLNYLNSLEHVTIRADFMRLDFSNTINSNIKKVTIIPLDDYLQSSDKLISSFPNSEIEFLLS